MKTDSHKNTPVADGFSIALLIITVILVIIAMLLPAPPAKGQINYREWRNWSDSVVRVKILKVWMNKKDNLTYVWLKNLETNQKVWTEGCRCEVPYKRRDLVWIDRKLFSH